MTTHDILRHDWQKLRGKLQERWYSLTDVDVRRINGDYETLVEVLQERYFYSRPTAEHDVNQFLNGFAMTPELAHS